MEVYQWRLNTPGNYHGIVLASDDRKAVELVQDYVSYALNECTTDIDLAWIGFNGTADPDIYMLKDM